MAKQNFLDNFRIARNLFFHPRVAAELLCRGIPRR